VINCNRIPQGTTRQNVYQFIVDHPNSSLDEIAAGVGITKTPVKYHVNCLISEGKISNIPGKHRSLKVV